MLIVLPTLEEAEKLIATLAIFSVEAKVSGRVIDTPKGQNSKIDIASEV